MVIEVAKIIMKEKTPLSHEVVCFLMLDFETSILNLRTRNQIHGKLLFSRKLYVTSEGAVFTMFCTTNSSPLLVTKTDLMLIIILSNYQ